MADDEVIQTTVRLPASLIKAAKVYAAQHDIRTGFNGAVELALQRLLKGVKS
jgi:hypothetical protein